MTREQLIETLVRLDMDRIIEPNDRTDAEYVLSGILRYGWIGYDKMITPHLRDMMRELTEGAEE